MTTIGIIGANGQVGTEVCLFLNNWEDVRIIAVCRTKLGSAVLRAMGIECRHGSMKDVDVAKDILSDCDLVADFSLPKGAAEDIKSVYRTNITNTLENMPLQSKYVFISSLMAFGMKGSTEVFKNHWVPKTVYAATKRYGENLSFQLGKKRNIDVFVLRLGEVHGLLQTCSKSWRTFFENDYPTIIVPNKESYAVFSYTIAEALVNIAKGKEKPDIYSLGSNPDWSYEELFTYLAKKPVKVELAAIDRKSITWYPKLKNLVVTGLKNNKELAQAYLFKFLPGYEQKIKLKHWTSQIHAKETLYNNAFKHLQVIKGIAPGKRLSSISDSRVTMHDKVLLCEQVIGNLVRK